MNIPTYFSGTIQVRAYRTLRQVVYRSLEPYKINPTQWSIIGQAYLHKDGVRLTEIAEALDAKPPQITLLVNQLIKAGFIKKVAHMSDKRAKLIVLTQQGRKLVSEIEKALSKDLSTLLKGLTQKDMTTYHKVLTTIIENNYGLTP